MVNESSGIKGFVGFFKSIKVKLICYFILMTTIPILIVSSTAYNSGKKALNERVVEKLTSIADLKRHSLVRGYRSELLILVFFRQINP